MNRLEKTSHLLFCIYCLSASISIALSQIALIPMILLWGFGFWLRPAESSSISESAIIRKAARPVAYWLLLALIASLVGINPGKALSEFLKTAIYLSLPFCVASLINHSFPDLGRKLSAIKNYCLLLLGSQLIAGLHSLLSSYKGYEVWPKVPGPVTESGQLTLILPVAVGLVVFSWQESRSRSSLATILLAFVVSLVSFLLFAWPSSLANANVMLVQVTSSIVAIGVIAVLSIRKMDTKNTDIYLAQFFSVIQKWISKLLPLILALLVACLLINLKRGPWLGIFVGMFFLGSLISYRLAALAVAFPALMIAIFEPIRTRLLQLSEHFSISGGRKEMWEMGLELVERYSLGVGLDNASFIQVLDPSLPELHRHVHNNFLNLAVETGSLGLCVFLWWMVLIITLGIKSTKSLRKYGGQYSSFSVITAALGAAIVSWQVAGLAEYNFGDVEVRLLALTLIGFIIAIASSKELKLS